MSCLSAHSTWAVKRWPGLQNRRKLPRFKTLGFAPSAPVTHESAQTPAHLLHHLELIPIICGSDTLSEYIRHGEVYWLLKDPAI